MRALCLILFGACCFLLASCSSSSNPQDLIVGKWELVGEEPGIVEEYTKDGKRKGLRGGKVSVESSYRFLDDNTIEYTTGGNKSTYKVSVTKDALTLTSGDNQVEKFKRVK